MDADKLKKLDKAYSDLSKQYGKDIVKDVDKIDYHIPRHRLLSPSLNFTMGGGLPKGRIIEFYGPPSGGKSSISTIMAGDIQLLYGAYIVYLDIEHSFDYDYAMVLGINISDEQFKVIQPEWGEQAMNILQKLVESQAVDVIIIDSVAALVPKTELEGAMGDVHMALQARLMSQAMRKLTAIVAKSGTTLIFINQTRMKIGTTWGSPVTTTGGEALKFYASIRQNISRVEYIKDSKTEEIIGSRIKIKCVKNKTAPPMREVEIELYYKTGLNITKEYLNFGITYGLIKKAGAWYSIGDERLGQGKNKAVDTLNSDGFKDILINLKKTVDYTLFPPLAEEGMKEKREKIKEKKREIKKVRKVKEEK